MAKAGLRKVTKTVRGKKGSVRRSYWVKTKQATHGFMQRHGKKVAAVAGAAALAGGAYLAHKHRGAISAKAGEFNKSFAAFRRGSGASLAKKLVSAAGNKLVEHAGESAGRRVFGAIGHAIGGEHGRELGHVLGEAIGGTAASHFGDRHVERAATAASKRVRESGYARKNGRFVRSS